ncbi:MAG: hypothetical protein ACYSU4_18955 [Planctomycetota bacterium]|jgi:hypothetical protein
MNKNGEVKQASLSAGVDFTMGLTANTGADDIEDKKWREVLLLKIGDFLPCKPGAG